MGTELLMKDNESFAPSKLTGKRSSLKNVSFKVQMKPRKKSGTMTSVKRGPSKKTLLAVAALSCRKMTSWASRVVVDPVMKARQETAQKKSDQWIAKNICTCLVQELEDEVVARSVSGKLLEVVLTKAWYEIKLKKTWNWLEGDKELQKSVMMMIQREEEKSRLRLAEQKRVQRLSRKQEMVQLWSQRRKEKSDEEASLQESGVDHLAELVKCMTLMQEMECASEGWMTWQCEIG
jgi:hypothetical protein